MTTTNTIIIGKKPVANYALAVACRHGQGATSVTLRARGKLIGIAIDAANMALNMGLPFQRGEARWGQEEKAPGQPVSYVEVDLISTEA